MDLSVFAEIAIAVMYLGIMQALEVRERNKYRRDYERVLRDDMEDVYRKSAYTFLFADRLERAQKNLDWTRLIGWSAVMLLLIQYAELNFLWETWGNHMRYS